MIKPKQINKLLAFIRDKKKPMEKHSVALKNLEKEINKFALGEESSLETNFSTFKQQWQPFKKMILTFESDYNNIDEYELDELIEQESDRVRLEKMNHSTSSPKKLDSATADLEQRWQALHEFKVKGHKTLNESAGTLTFHEENDEFADLDGLDEQISEKSLELSCFISNNNQMIGYVNQGIALAEKSVREIEKELHILKTQVEEKPQLKQPKPLNTPVVDEYDTPVLSKNKINLQTASVQTRISKQEKAILENPKADKPNIFDAFLKNIKSFIQTIGNCIKKIGKNNIPLPEALKTLQDTRKQLENSWTRLENTKENLKNSCNEIAKNKTVQRSEFTKLNEDYKEIQKQREILYHVRLKKDLTQYNLTLTKGELIQKLQSDITTLELEHIESIRSLKEISHQLNKTTAKANLAYEDLKDAIVMHKVATASVDKAIKNVEQAKNQEKHIEQQQQIKEVLSQGRKESENAKKLMESTEMMLETSHQRP